jgi:hypothetical protein
MYSLELPCTQTCTHRKGAYYILVRKPEGKRSLGRPNHRQYVNDKMNLKDNRVKGKD